MYNGFFCLGGTEIINNARAIQTALTAPCPIRWFDDDVCDGIYDMLGDTWPTLPGDVYSYANISDTPWYDDGAYTRDDSTAFLGIYCISAENLSDSTASADVTERIDDGGVIGRQRRSSRGVRFRVLLSAMTEAGLEYGLSWLDSRLAEKGCSTHPGSSCGTSDLFFFVECAGAFDPSSDDWTSYTQRVDQRSRMLHGVKCVSAPLIQTKFERGPRDGGTYARWGYVVEFTLQAEQPNLFGLSYTPEVTNWGTLIAADAPTNLVYQPSAEVADAVTVNIATNYSTNPSVETDATGWNAASTAVAPTATGAQSAELFAVGTKSYKVSTTTTNSGTNGALKAYQDVTLPTGAPYRYSLSMWAAAVITSGTAVASGVQMLVEWRNSTTLLRADTLASGGAAGTAMSAESLVPPAGATFARCLVVANFASWSVGAKLALYADALALTVP